MSKRAFAWTLAGSVGRHSVCWATAGGFFLCATLCAADPPTLSAPVRAGDQFQFILTGQTNTSYIIEASTDLQTWKPVRTNYQSTSIRAITITSASDQCFFKAIKVVYSLYDLAVAAQSGINLNGNNLIIDSFDSTDPLYSTDGEYDLIKAKDSGNLGAFSSLDMANAKVKGKIHLGPGASFTMGPNGGVGSSAWITNGNHGIEPAFLLKDLNLDFPQVSAPFDVGFTPAAGTVEGTNYTYVLGTANYQVQSLNLSGNDNMIVTGNAVLFITGDLTITNQAFVLLSAGASLRLYMGGTNANLGGGGIINLGRASNFAYYGLSSNTALNITLDYNLIGLIYGPNAQVSIRSGAGSTPHAFVGSCFANFVSLTGTFNYHYDESFSHSTPSF